MKPRKIPQRTCVGCRVVKNKKELVRIVRDPAGLIDVDLTGKKSGRGAYICPQIACLDASLKGKRLASALEADIPEEVVGSLRERIESVK